MPLSFRSKRHGNIAFGFFNIESDMLLLEHYFFFADQFCSWMIALAEQSDDADTGLNCPVFDIPDPRDIGDLMGAIHGIRFTGFMGTIYRRFPFPEDPDGFKQNPQGDRTREIVTSEIQNFATRKNICIELSKEGQFHMGPYGFDTAVFHELIRYVWQGGYPRWKDEIRPSYLREMKTRIQASPHPLFQGAFKK